MSEPGGSARLHVERRGGGLPVMGLAGFGCSHWIFNHWTAPLESECRLILPDNRGMGQSPRATADYEISDLAEDARSVLLDEAPDGAVVMGVSMGGFIAQALALRAPTMVKALILMCTSGAGPSFIELPHPSRDGLEAFYKLDPPQRAKQAIDGTTHPGFAVRDPQGYAQVLRDRAEQGADWDQVAFQYDAVQRFLLLAQPISRIDCPTLILTGACDRFVDPKNSRILAKSIPHARLVEIPESDHLFFLERPDETVSQIKMFLAELA